MFANESEIIALTKTADFESAIAAIRGQCETLVITQGEKGAWLATAGEEVRVPAITSGDVVDLTGAGDAFVEQFGSVAELQGQLERDRLGAQDALARHGSPMDQSRASHA